MKIRYRKKRLKYFKILGMLWFILGSTAVIFDASNYFSYGYLLIGILSIGTYLFEKSNQFLSIENGTLTKNTLFPKTINLIEIKQIKKIAGDYILKTEDSEFRINTAYIEEDSLLELNAVLENLNLETT